VKKGDRYVINGTKIFISGVSQSRWGIVFARTGGPGRGGVSAFIVERDKPGLKWSPFPVIRAYSPYELHFEDYEVPEENLLGEEGKGFALAEEWLVHERVPYAAATIGLGQKSMELAIEWARQRETFGAPLSERQAVQFSLADCEIELRAARLLVYEAAWKADRGEDIKHEASICKVYGTEVAGRVVDRCIQIFGGMGVSQEMPLERWYRELRIKRIGEGPSEIHRMVIARNLLGARKR
jgi:acyl-CoA dehydrogenase